MPDPDLKQYSSLKVLDWGVLIAAVLLALTFFQFVVSSAVNELEASINAKLGEAAADRERIRAQSATDRERIRREILEAVAELKGEVNTGFDRASLERSQENELTVAEAWLAFKTPTGLPLPLTFINPSPVAVANILGVAQELASVDVERASGSPLADGQVFRVTFRDHLGVISTNLVVEMIRLARKDPRASVFVEALGPSGDPGSPLTLQPFCGPGFGKPC